MTGLAFLVLVIIVFYLLWSEGRAWKKARDLKLHLEQSRFTSEIALQTASQEVKAALQDASADRQPIRKLEDQLSTAHLEKTKWEGQAVANAKKLEEFALEAKEREKSPDSDVPFSSRSTIASPLIRSKYGRSKLLSEQAVYLGLYQDSSGAYNYDLYYDPKSPFYKDEGVFVDGGKDYQFGTAQWLNIPHTRNMLQWASKDRPIEAALLEACLRAEARGLLSYINAQQSDSKKCENLQTLLDETLERVRQSQQELTKRDLRNEQTNEALRSSEGNLLNLTMRLRNANDKVTKLEESLKEVMAQRDRANTNLSTQRDQVAMHLRGIDRVKDELASMEESRDMIYHDRQQLRASIKELHSQIKELTEKVAMYEGDKIKLQPIGLAGFGIRPLAEDQSLPCYDDVPPQQQVVETYNPAKVQELHERLAAVGYQSPLIKPLGDDVVPPASLSDRPST